MPFRFIGRLARLEVDAHGTEIGCAAFLWGAAEDVLAPCNFKIDESGHHDRYLQLCFQQSAGNSAGPEIDLPFSAVRDLSFHQNVGDA